MRGKMRLLEGAYIADSATVTGDVTLGEGASVWFGSVLRGDDAAITIGAFTNIQDLSMVHADPGVPNVIGPWCTVGHRVVLHGAEIEEECLIGMGAILLGGSRIGRGSIIGAGAVVKENAVIPPRSLVVGVPAKIIRQVEEADVRRIRESAEDYYRKALLYLADPPVSRA